MIEHEAKILEVDPVDIKERVLRAGGLVLRSALQRRYVYDIDPADQSRWIRLRDNGAAVTLAVKHVRHDGIDGTDEVEVTVDSFEAAHELLGLQGFTAKAYQENRRTSYRLGTAQIEVDRWPMIPPYLEIEGESIGHVESVAKCLGFRSWQLTAENTTKIYARYGIVLAEHPDLRFVA